MTPPVRNPLGNIESLLSTARKRDAEVQSDSDSAKEKPNSRNVKRTRCNRLFTWTPQVDADDKSNPLALMGDIHEATSNKLTESKAGYAASDREVATALGLGSGDGRILAMDSTKRSGDLKSIKMSGHFDASSPTNGSTLTAQATGATDLVHGPTSPHANGIPLHEAQKTYIHTAIEGCPHTEAIRLDKCASFETFFPAIYDLLGLDSSTDRLDYFTVAFQDVSCITKIRAGTFEGYQLIMDYVRGWMEKRRDGRESGLCTVIIKAHISA